MTPEYTQWFELESRMEALAQERNALVLQQKEGYAQRAAAEKNKDQAAKKSLSQQLAKLEAEHSRLLAERMALRSQQAVLRVPPTITKADPCSLTDLRAFLVRQQNDLLSARSAAEATLQHTKSRTLYTNRRIKAHRELSLLDGALQVLDDVLAGQMVPAVVGGPVRSAGWAVRLPDGRMATTCTSVDGADSSQPGVFAVRATAEFFAQRVGGSVAEVLTDGTSTFMVWGELAT